MKKQTKLNKKTAEFIAKARKVHGDTYNYDKVEYVSNKKKVVITCKEHGDFEKIPNAHLSGTRCPYCREKSRREKEKSNNMDFIAKARKVHGDTYNYDKVEYVKSNQKVIITCKEHGDFAQIPNSHLRGSGCPSCAVHGFDKSKPAILYYLSIDNGTAYKIGITNRTVEERYSATDLNKIKVIFTVRYQNGAVAYSSEQSILSRYSYAKWTGDDMLTIGNTELFYRDILLKDLGA